MYLLQWFCLYTLDIPFHFTFIQFFIIPVKLFTTQFRWNSPQEKYFKNIDGKGENASFSALPTIFSTLHKANFNFLVKFIMYSANAFNLDKCCLVKWARKMCLNTHNQKQNRTSVHWVVCYN